MEKMTLKAARINANLTQKKAAELIGVSFTTLSNYETGKTSPTQKRCIKIAEVYNIPVELLRD